MRSDLEWSVLDVEEEEWDRHLAALGGAGAHGAPAAAPPEAGGTGLGGWRGRCRRWRSIAAGVVALLMLVGASGYTTWRRAQAGVAQIEADMAGVVQLENVKARRYALAAQVGEQVEAVELRDHAAMVQVVISYLLPSGEVIGLRQARFYVQRGSSWQRTESVPAFWGEQETLDTANLHFVFGALDRAAVEQIAPTAEVLYAGLMRATGQRLTRRGALTVELVPGGVEEGAVFAGGRIRVTSPVLFVPLPHITGEETLARLLRDAMCKPMLSAAAGQVPIKGQWRPIAEGLNCVVLSRAIVAQAPGTPAVFGETFSAGAPRLRGVGDLLDKAAWDAAVSHQAAAAGGAETYMSHEREEAAAELVAFLAAAYGLDALPRLLAGCGEYEDWGTLAPAVFGVSAAELEAAWRKGG